MMLFRHADDFDPWAGNTLHGEIDGREWLILEFGYVGNSVDGLVDGHRLTAFRQTIALVANVGDVPDFLLQPRSSEWNRVTPGWPVRLDAGRRVCVIGGAEAADVWSRQRDATDDFFTPAREEFFADLPGWTVEMFDGNLLVYREDRGIKASELEDLVAVVRDVVDELTREELPVLRERPRSDEGPEGGHIRGG